MINVDISHLKRKNLKKNRIKKSLSVKNEEKINNENELLPSNIEVNFELSENQELNKYLIMMSQELLGVQINARLHLGRIFQEVHQKLAGSPHDGIYVQWLEINGFNKMTALRHRNRFKLYQLMPTDHLKYLIASTSQKIVEAILNDKEKFELLISMDSKLNKSELSVIAFSSDNQIILEKEFQFDIYEEYGVFKEKVEKLDLNRLNDKQKLKFSKLVDNFNKLLKEIN